MAEARRLEVCWFLPYLVCISCSLFSFCIFGLVFYRKKAKVAVAGSTSASPSDLPPSIGVEAE
jgi:hypothetical protein